MSRVRWSGGAVVLVTLGALSALGGCGSDTLRTETGVVVDVDQSGLATVDGFTLRLADGREMRFDTSKTRFDTAGFPPQHLQEHRALAEAVRVTYQVRDDVNRVVKLEDAE